MGGKSVSLRQSNEASSAVIRFAQRSIKKINQNEDQRLFKMNKEFQSEERESL